jgi:thiol-disulfide isomerase/thioredoxin
MSALGFGRRLAFPLAALCLVSAAGNACGAEAEFTMPRYQLQVGQELNYRGGSEFKYESGKFVTRETWRVWVTEKNADGSWRLAFRHGSRFQQIRNEQPDAAAGEFDKLKKAAEKLLEKQAEPEKEIPEEVQVGWADFHPDGRMPENPSFGFRLQPARLFPQLPADHSEIERGWMFHSARMDETSKCRMLPSSGPGRFDFEVVRESPMNEIYGMEYKDVITFDQTRGVPEKIASETKQTYGFKGEGTGVTELVGIKTLPADEIAALASELKQFFAARDAYEAVTHRKDLSGDDFKAALGKAAIAFELAAADFKNADLKELVKKQLDSHERMVNYLVESANDRNEVIGKPSDEWSTTDLSGAAHALKDYRGKVVILDFWYRGCGWCIRAMPQMKQVAAHYKDRPVVVFGMNTDRKEEDAQFVIDRMQLNYSNLKATGLPEKYKVRGFPTLIILDQEGVIRDLHVGYSPTLKESVIESVDRLLTAKP